MWKKMEDIKSDLQNKQYNELFQHFIKLTSDTFGEKNKQLEEKIKKLEEELVKEKEKNIKLSLDYENLTNIMKDEFKKEKEQIKGDHLLEISLKNSYIDYLKSEISKKECIINDLLEKNNKDDDIIINLRKCLSHNDYLKEELKRKEDIIKKLNTEKESIFSKIIFGNSSQIDDTKSNFSFILTGLKLA